MVGPVYLRPLIQKSMTRVVLVTGASSGIGQAIAEHLAAKGLIVFGASRHAQNGEQNAGVYSLRMDVTDEPSVISGIEYILQHSGRLDVVVNNAGLGIVGPVESISNEEVEMIFRTNVYGVLNVCRHTAPLLRKQGSGYIINITSIAGAVGLPFRGIYSSSKFAVEGLTESLSQELSGFGVKVCLIEPGDFRTNINQSRKVPTFIDEAYQPACANTLAQVNREVGHAPTPEPVATCVWDIIHTPSPRLRYRVATFTQKLSVTLKRLLPGRWFEAIIKRYYKLK